MKNENNSNQSNNTISLSKNGKFFRAGMRPYMFFNLRSEVGGS